MEYVNTTEKNESTNSFLLSFLTVVGIFILFLAIFQEADSTYAHGDNKDQMIVVESRGNR